MDLTLLKNKDYSLLMIGKLVSLLGNMLQFALSLYVLSLTGSALIFASMLSISILPRLLLSPIAGVFGDWFNRKKAIVFLDFINGTLIATFALIFLLNGGLTLLLIYAFVILLEIIEIFFGAMAAFLAWSKKRFAAFAIISLTLDNYSPLLLPRLFMASLGC